VAIPNILKIQKLKNAKEDLTKKEGMGCAKKKKKPENPN
jgi:hypothetical protein